MPNEPRCVFCGDPAIGAWHLERGCVGRRGDVGVEQDLCIQHASSATPLGRMTLVADYTRDGVLEDDVRDNWLRER